MIAAPRFTRRRRRARKPPRQRLPIVAAVNKIDRVRPRDRLLPLLARVADAHDYAAVVPIAATTGDNLGPLIDVLVPLLPVGPPAWPAEQVTDRSERFLAAEALRGQLMLGLFDELPYGIAVEIERFETATVAPRSTP